MEYNESLKDGDTITQLTETVEGETPQGYHAFLFWINLPASERYTEQGLTKCADNAGLSYLTVKSYKNNNKWNDRIKQIDAHFARVQFNQRVEANKEHNLKFAEEARKIQTDALAVSKQAITVCKNLLDSAALSSKTIETDWVKVLQPDGSHKKVPLTTTIQMESKLSDVAPLLRIAVEVPTKIAGLPVQDVGMETQTMPGNGTPMTKTQIDERRRMLAKEKAKITGIDQMSEGIN